ncbi:hypothetical protein MBLNU457_5265t1 [Dothideomycetes sp. NU457]
MEEMDIEIAAALGEVDVEVKSKMTKLAANNNNVKEEAALTIEEEVEYEAYLESLPNAYLQFDDEDDEDDEDDKDNEDNEDDEDDEDDEGDEGNEGEDDRKDDEDDDIAINKTDK